MNRKTVAPLRHERTMLLIVFLSGLISALNTGLLYIAYMTLAETFHTDINTVQWLTAIFSLTSAMVTPTASYFAKRYSLRNMLMLAFVILVTASIGCALAPNIQTLIACRAVQGIASGIMQPLSMTIIYQWIPKEKQGMFLSISLMGMSLGPAIGPTLSGFFLTVFDWHAIFICNVPVALLNLALVYGVIPKEARQNADPVDIHSILTVFAGTLLILLGVYEAGSIGWMHLSIWFAIFCGMALLTFFVHMQLRAERPFLDFHTFRIRRFTISVIVSAILYANVTLIAFLMPIFLENAQEMAPLRAGTLLFVPAICMALATPIAGRTYAKTSARTQLLWGLGAMLIGTCLITTFDETTTPFAIILMLSVRYIGAAFANVPSLDFGLGALPKEKASDGTAMNNWIKSMAISISLTIFTTIYSLREGQFLVEHPQSAPAAAAVSVHSDLFWLQGATLLFALLLVFFTAERDRSSNSR